MRTQVMVPGILVALKTSLHGGIQYDRQVLEEDEDGKMKKWETTRTMEDPAEHKAASEVQARAYGLVSKLCVRTSFGLLCPSDRERELDEAVTTMREMVTDWNRRARYSFVQISAIKGRIADNDEEAIRAILDEARDLLERMDRGLAEDDVTLIRDAASRAKRLSQMMVSDTGSQVESAVEAARKAARAIVKRGGDLRDRVGNAMVEVERDAFNTARFSFLDTMETAIEALPSVNLQRGAELEVEEEVTV